MKVILQSRRIPFKNPIQTVIPSNSIIVTPDLIPFIADVAVELENPELCYLLFDDLGET
jgi:hypothetical protein